MKKTNDLFEIEKEVRELQKFKLNKEKAEKLETINYKNRMQIYENEIASLYDRLLEYRNNIAPKLKTSVCLQESYWGGKEIVFSIGTSNRNYRGATFEFVINSLNGEHKYNVEQRSNSYTQGIDKHIVFEQRTLGIDQLIKQLNYYCSLEITGPSKYVYPYWAHDLVKKIIIIIGFLVYLCVFIVLVSFWEFWGGLLGIILGLVILGSLD